ncbi:MAG: hypothetical protein HOP28_10070 [Gemmatimonadales bacterium]|nr:hypothetical protein [Gemmatimonadales bacterium]
MRTLHGLAIAAFVVAGPASTFGPQAQGPPALTGLVYDSTGFGALEGVKVSLIGGTTSARTDLAGRYRLTGLTAGPAQVRFEHPRLDLLLGEVVGEVEIRSDSTAFNLLIGSGRASHGTMCGADSVRGAPAAGFFGMVWLGGTDTLLTGAEVAVTWAEGGKAQRRGVVARADQFGGYRLCGIPAGVKALVAARGAGRESKALEVVLEPGEMATWDMVVGAPVVEAAATSIRGRVTNGRNGEPVLGAEVVLLQSGKKATTDQNGAFTMTGVEAGRAVSMVRRIGFRPIYRDITIQAGQTVDVAYTIEPSGARLPTVTVNAPAEADPTLRGFEERRARGIGTFFGPQELRRAEGRSLATVLRKAPGLKIVRERRGGETIAVSNRRLSNVQTLEPYAPIVGALAIGTPFAFCPYAIVLDGKAIYKGTGEGMVGRNFDSRSIGNPSTIPPDLNTFIGVASLKAVEVYSGPGETPGEYASLGSQCGVIVLWTR